MEIFSDQVLISSFLQIQNIYYILQNLRFFTFYDI